MTSVPGCASAWSLRRGISSSDEHRRPRRDPHRAPRGRRRHGNREVGVGGRERERAEHCDERARDARRRRPPVGREERDPVRARRLVEEVEGATLSRPTPGSAKADLAHVEQSVQRDPRARPRRVRRRREHAVAEKDPARPPVCGREVVAVDTDGRRLRGEALLHRRDGLPENDRLVREHGPQAIEADGAWAANDVEGHRPVRRELNAALVRGSGEERRRLGGSGSCPGAQTEESGKRGE